MVNPQYGGGGPVLPPPTGLRFDFLTLTFYWDEVPQSTSYSLEYSPDGIVAYVEIYSGTALEFAYTPPAEGNTFYRIRSRNAQGYSEFSPILTQGYFSVLPPPSNLAVALVSGTTNSVKLSWDVVPSAERYKIYKSIVNVGDPVGANSNIGQVDANEFIETVDSGHRYYYHVTAENGNQWSAISGDIFIDVV
jgi:hypothetical protein